MARSDRSEGYPRAREERTGSAFKGNDAVIGISHIVTGVTHRLGMHRYGCNAMRG